MTDFKILKMIKNIYWGIVAIGMIPLFLFALFWEMIDNE